MNNNMRSNKMRVLLERLPGPAGWATFIKMVIVHSGTYKPFMQQCLQNSSNWTESSESCLLRRPNQVEQRNTTALDRALSWHRVAHVHQRVVIAVYFYLIIKYRLLALISLDSSPLGNFQYLDCFIPGRFRFVGRTNKIAGEVASTFFIWFLVFRVLNHTQDYKFYALEFMLTGHECPFDRSANKWILRPNRTGESWLALALHTKAILYCTLLVLPSWFGLITWALAGSIQTNLGFELSYPACVSWLRNVQTNPTATHNYSYIYLAPEVLAHEIPIDQIPARIPFDARDLLQRGASPFKWLRILFDVIENCSLYSEHFLLFATTFYMFVIHSIDVNLNAVGIKIRMLRLIKKLEAQRELFCERKQRAQFYARLIGGPPWHESGYNFEKVHDSWHTDEMENLQAILADHFNTLTRGYNKSISITFIFMGLGWLHYTVILCNWMTTFRSRAVELEFLVAETLATMMCLTIMLSFVLVRSQNLQLYPLITRAMALDPDWSTSKLRWATTLKYFHPRPFYCFTIAGSTEISWLLCLKILSWIMSAFCVLANYFYMYR